MDSNSIWHFKQIFIRSPKVSHFKVLKNFGKNLKDQAHQWQWSDKCNNTTNNKSMDSIILFYQLIRFKYSPKLLKLQNWFKYPYNFLPSSDSHRKVKYPLYLLLWQQPFAACAVYHMKCGRYRLWCTVSFLKSKNSSSNIFILITCWKILFSLFFLTIYKEHNGKF